MRGYFKTEGMSITIAVRKETADHETRVAVTPETVKKFSSLGCEVIIEKGAGVASGITDTAYTDAGAKIAKNTAELLKPADILLTVGVPDAKDVALMQEGALLFGLLNPHSKDAAERIAFYKDSNVRAFSLEKLPRISRAQSMDVLSSQANLAGYRAVIEATYLYGRGFPMMMTAAGTVTPAKVFVMGAGVAGLQAIATAKRLGAVVSATDVRAAAKEQVQSLGATFVMIDMADSETAGGYARALTEDEQKAQAALIAETLPKMDVVITTALIPGRPAPVLVTEAMVKSMKPGSVIVDMAVSQGGNCPLSKPDQVVETENGVKIVGYTNLPARIGADASQLYAKNLYNFLALMIKDGALNIPEEDQLIIDTKL